LCWQWCREWIDCYALADAPPAIVAAQALASWIIVHKGQPQVERWKVTVSRPGGSGAITQYRIFTGSNHRAIARQRRTFRQWREMHGLRVTMERAEAPVRV
jgi:hypothetical protein